MPSVKVPTNFNIDVEFEIPEFYKRLIAVVIDYILLWIYIKISEEIIKSAAMNGSDWEDLYWLSIAVIAGPVLIYFPVTEITMRGQTIGKKIMNLQVVNENGGKASISQIMIRWLVRDIWFFFLLQMGQFYGYVNSQIESVFLIMVVLGYFVTEIILVVSSKKCQRIGDILARTILIDIKKRGNIEDTVFQEVADNYVPSFPEIMRLSDKDINAIKSILETARKKGDYNMAESAAIKIKTHLKISSAMDPFDFLDVLLKDYNYLSTK